VALIELYQALARKAASLEAAFLLRRNRFAGQKFLVEE